MILNPVPINNSKFILRGLHVELEDEVKLSIEKKVERLFRHEPRMVRVRIDVERVQGGTPPLYAAKGHIEISGPDLLASVTTEDPRKSVDLLIDKLDRQLRKRSTALQGRRTNGDIRALA